MISKPDGTSFRYTLDNRPKGKIYFCSAGYREVSNPVEGLGQEYMQANYRPENLGMMKKPCNDGSSSLGEVVVCLWVSDAAFDDGIGALGGSKDGSFIRARPAYDASKGRCITFSERRKQILEQQPTNVADMDGAGEVVVDVQESTIYRVGWNVQPRQGAPIGRSNCFYRMQRKGSEVTMEHGTIGKDAHQKVTQLRFGDNAGVAAAFMRRKLQHKVTCRGYEEAESPPRLGPKPN